MAEETKKPAEGKQSGDDKKKSIFEGVDLVQIVLALVALVCVYAAVMRMAYGWDKVDQQTAMFLGLAIIALIAPQITKFEGFGITVEKAKKLAEEAGERVKEEIHQEVQQVERLVGKIEKGSSLPGKRAPANEHRKSVADDAEAAVVRTDAWNSDPNSGAFGGSPESNGRRLSAKITPVAGDSSPACDVRFWVESTDPAKPLTSDVTFYLHPTFGRWAKYAVTPKNGIAKDKITSWGAFTLAAETDGGATKLELDLGELEGGTDPFKNG